MGRKPRIVKYKRIPAKTFFSTLLLVAALILPAFAEGDGLKLFEDLQNHLSSASDQVKSSVVHIEVLAKRGEQRHKGLGSGLILSPDGKIVTNHHVIDRAQVITVILDDKTKLEAQVLRRDQQTDLALLQVQAGRPLPAARLADSDQVRVGEWVLAIGNPYGFDRTVSFGIVSGKGRFIPGLDSGVPLLNDFIQTDALIDPGNSGGPLVNLHGEVIGINSVGIGRGQGFTIPSNVVRDVITRTEVEGRIQRGWLGIYLQPFTPEMADYLGHARLRGVLISDLVKGGPADQAGLKSGDVLTRFDQVDLDADSDDSINRFIQMVSSLEPKTRIPIQIHRQGQVLERNLTVGIQPPVDATEVDTDFGFGAKQITQALFLEYRLDQREGVLVSYVTRGSPAQEANLEVGDVIIRVDSTPIRTVEDFRNQLGDLQRRARFLITLKRGTVTRYALIDLARYRAPNRTP